MVDYEKLRRFEIQTAINSFFDEMDEIQMKRLELSRQEIEAWKYLKQVIYADDPENFCGYFGKDFNE